MHKTLAHSECDKELNRLNGARKVVNFTHNLHVLLCTSCIVLLHFSFLSFRLLYSMVSTQRHMNIVAGFADVFGSHCALIAHTQSHIRVMFCV